MISGASKFLIIPSLFPWAGIDPASPNAAEIARSVAIGSKVIARSFDFIYQETGVSTISPLPERPLVKNPAVRLVSLSGKSVARRRRRTDLPKWGNTRERLKETLEYVVTEYLDGNVGRIVASEDFRASKYKLSSGEIVTGRMILGAVARLQWPEMSSKVTLNLRVGEIARIAKEEYLKDLYDQQDWGRTRERLRVTLLFVVDKYLDGDVGNVRNSKNFTAREFSLPTGHVVNGRTLLVALARLEWPEMNAGSFVGSRGAEVARVAREKYLSALNDEQDWCGTFEKLKNALTYVVERDLDGDVSRVKAHPGFMRRMFMLPTGCEVSGGTLLRAVAKLESPDLGAAAAYREIGGGAAARIAREKYLSELHDKRDWRGTFERLKQTLSYVVDNFYDGNVMAVMASPGFVNRRYALSSGQKVTGHRLLTAVARLERPEMSIAEVLDDINFGGLARIAREKYLAELWEEREWGGTFEKLRDALAYVVIHHLDGDVNKVVSHKGFRNRVFTLRSGQKVSGHRLLAGVAKVERPGMSTEQATMDIGYGELVRIAREKYLFSLDDTPESFIKAMKMVMDDDENGGDA